jgi:hypothetical protein
VLAWGGALTVLAVGAGVLTEFAYVLTAERLLLVAARAGAMEATLPRATYESVTAVIERRLAGNPRLAGELHISLAQNGSLVQQRFHRGDGDRFDVSAWAPKSAAVPDWLRRFTFWRSETQIQVHANRQVPGRKLPLLKT